MDIYVGNLPYTATREDIDDLFRPHGHVSDIRLVADRESGRPKGFAFVSMPNTTDARRAIQALNGSSLEGRPLRVNTANDGRPRRAANHDRRGR